MFSFLCFQIKFKTKSFRNTKSLDHDGPDLGLNSLQRLSEDNNGRQRVTADTKVKVLGKTMIELQGMSGNDQLLKMQIHNYVPARYLLPHVTLML